MVYVCKTNELIKISQSTKYMGVSKNRGVPQNGWFIMENSIEIIDLGGKPTIFGNNHIS